MGTSGSEGGPEKPTSRKASRAPRSDPYTEHRTGEGKLYLCAIKDVFSNRIVGYSIDSRMKSRLATTALSSAVARRGWVMITNDRRLRTRPVEAELAITHKLKVVHLHGDVGSKPAWDQLIRLTTRWTNVTDQESKEGPLWLSLRKGPPQLMRFEPGVAER